jgi:hypothetical protein
MKRPGHLILRCIPILLLLGTASAAKAADPDLSKYPLRMKVLHAVSSNEDAPFYVGGGEANLILSPGAEGIDFQYDDCLGRIHLSGPHLSVAVRWKKPGKELEALVPYSKPGKSASPGKTEFAKCTLHVVTHDFVFVPRRPSAPAVAPTPVENDIAILSGRQVEQPANVAGPHDVHLTTLPLKDYAKDPALQALIEGATTVETSPRPTVLPMEKTVAP